MSIQALSWALNDAPVTDQGQLLVLIGLAEHADAHGRDAFPTRSQLAEYARCSTRTVQRHLIALEDAGIISRGDQQLVAHRRADRRPVVYDLSGVSPRKPLNGVTNCHPVAPRRDTGGQNGVTTVSHRTVLVPSIKERGREAGTLRPIRPASTDTAREAIAAARAALRGQS